MSVNGQFGPGQPHGHESPPPVALRQPTTRPVPVPIQYCNPAPLARDLDNLGLGKAYRHCICFVCAQKFAYFHPESGYVLCSRDCVEMAEADNLHATAAINYNYNPPQYVESGSSPYKPNNIVAREDYTMNEPTGFYNTDSVDAQVQGYENEPVKIKIEEFTEEFQTNLSLEPQHTAVTVKKEIKEPNMRSLNLDAAKNEGDVVDVKKVHFKEQLKVMLAGKVRSIPIAASSLSAAEKKQKSPPPVEKCSSEKGFDVGVKARTILKARTKTKPASENGQVGNTAVREMEMDHKTNMQVLEEIEGEGNAQQNNGAEGGESDKPAKLIKPGIDELLPLNNGRSIVNSENLVDGSNVKMMYFWSPKKVMVTDEKDEIIIYDSLQHDIEIMVKKYDLTLNHIPIEFDYYIGKYKINGEWYRGVVTKNDAEKKRVHFEFVDLGDHGKLEYSDLKMLTKELMDKHPIYSKSFALNNVPSPSSKDPEGFHDYFSKRVNEVFINQETLFKIQLCEKRKMNLTDVKTGKTLADFYSSELEAYKKNENEKA